jgi:tellurite resistance protein
MFLQTIPVSSFAMVMGLSALTLVWARIAILGWLPGFADTLAMGLALLDALVFLALLFLYARKWRRHPEQVAAEWQHPVKSLFFETVPISFALTATVALGMFAPLAMPLWIISACLQMLVMLMVINARVYRETLQPVHATPVWFIVAVANMVLPLAGVRLGFMELSWGFFSLGILFWIVLLTIVTARLLFVQPPLPERLVPTLCIFLAPPAMAFIAWLQLTGQHPSASGPSDLDATAHVLFWVALFFALFLLVQVRRFARLPFYLSWWTFSFPTAAFTWACLAYAQFVPTLAAQALALGMVVLTTLLIVWLFVRTIVAIVSGDPQFAD